MEKFIKIFWHEASGYEEGWVTWQGWILATFLVILITYLVVYSVWCWSKKDDEIQYNKAKLLGYSDMKDIEVFLSSLSLSWRDFFDSKSVRKQYELFARGESSDFQTQCKSKNNSRATTIPMIIPMHY